MDEVVPPNLHRLPTSAENAAESATKCAAGSATESAADCYDCAADCATDCDYCVAVMAMLAGCRSVEVR